MVTKQEIEREKNRIEEVEGDRGFWVPKTKAALLSFIFFSFWLDFFFPLFSFITYLAKPMILNLVKLGIRSLTFLR